MVPDLRRRRGRRHPLVAVLALAACATLVMGGDSVTAIWQWAARASQEKLGRLKARRHPFTGRFLVPSERTFRRVLARLDADALDAAIGGWVADVACGAVPAPVVAATPGPLEREERRVAQRNIEHPAPDGLLPAAAVDGKALRGARTPEGGRVFLVAAIDHATGAVLGQRQVPSKRGEGAAARDLLTGLHAPGMVWTLDALHTTKATARLITQDLHGHYLLIIKGNQPTARDAATALLAGPDTDWVATTATEAAPRPPAGSNAAPSASPPADACSLASAGLPASPRHRRPGRFLDRQGHRVRDHRRLPPTWPAPARAQPLRTTPLGRGRSSSLGPRRHLQRRQIAGQDRYSTTSARRLPQPDGQRPAPGRTRQHRPRSPRPPQPQRRLRRARNLKRSNISNRTSHNNAGALSRYRDGPFPSLIRHRRIL